MGQYSVSSVPTSLKLGKIRKLFSKLIKKTPREFSETRFTKSRFTKIFHMFDSVFGILLFCIDLIWCFCTLLKNSLPTPLFTGFSIRRRFSENFKHLSQYHPILSLRTKGEQFWKLPIRAQIIQSSTYSRKNRQAPLTAFPNIFRTCLKCSKLVCDSLQLFLASLELFKT